MTNQPQTQPTQPNKAFEYYLMLLQNKQIEVSRNTPAGETVRSLSAEEKLACALEAMGE